jgi:hypothetical protein
VAGARDFEMQREAQIIERVNEGILAIAEREVSQQWSSTDSVLGKEIGCPNQ